MTVFLGAAVQSTLNSTAVLGFVVHSSFTIESKPRNAARVRLDWSAAPRNAVIFILTIAGKPSNTAKVRLKPNAAPSTASQNSFTFAAILGKAVKRKLIWSAESRGLLTLPCSAH